MSPVPPVGASPGHPVPPDGDSHEVKLSEHEYKKRMAAWERQQELEKAEALGKTKAEAFWRRVWAIGAAGGVLILSTVGVVAWAQSKIDGGVAPVVKDLAEYKAEESDKHKAIDRHFERQDEKLDRMDQKIELILDAERVPKWKRPIEPKDGGK